MRDDITADKAECMIDGCHREVAARGRCHSHFEHWRRKGVDRGAFPETFADRFWEKVDKRGDDECWIWQGAADGGRRYGGVYQDGRIKRAHRVSYEMVNGPIPDGLVLDHLCRTTLCVNPSHLEAVTQRTNIMRGGAQAAINALKTHCKRGHEFTPDNTKMTSGGGRACVACAVEYNARRRRSYRKRRNNVH